MANAYGDSLIYPPLTTGVSKRYGRNRIRQTASRDLIRSASQPYWDGLRRHEFSPSAAGPVRQRLGIPRPAMSAMLVAQVRWTNFADADASIRGSCSIRHIFAASRANFLTMWLKWN